MNTAQAKKLSLPKIMSHLGYEPVEIKKGGQELWYCSPFRLETEASFHTSFLGGKWIWNDFGDTGGTVIDFVMRHEHYTQISDVLQFLDSLFQQELPLTTKPKKKRAGDLLPQPNLFSFQQQSAAKPPKISEANALTFISAHPISNPIIHSYLEARGIPPSLADRYLLEVAYHNSKNDREYFAFGMKNECGGYEIRSASTSYSFKSALNRRDITLIRGLSSTRKAVNVFEGMTDFLSLLVMMHTENLSGDSIILHSLSSFQRAANAIEREGYTSIHTFLDNNPAGQGGTNRFLTEFPKQTKAQSSLFAPHSDLNDALMANQIPDFLIDS